MSINRKLAVHIFIKGRVQGVSFRYFTLKHARELKITGWVQNKPNGNVEAFAQGKRKILKMFIKKLHQGSSYSRIDDVILNWGHQEKDYENFAII